MPTFLNYIIVIAGIIIGLGIWGLYHSMFNVVYFGCTTMIIEFFVCYLIGAGIVVLILSPILKLFGISIM